jgi:esterase/lipase superfamily enzyme
MKTTRFYISRSARPFVVWDALRTTVAQALSLVQEFPFEWCVLQDNAIYYVLPFREVVRALKGAPRKSTPLATTLGLKALTPSQVLQRKSDWIDLPKFPGVRSPAGRAVSLGKRGDTKIVSAVWVIQRSAPPIPSKPSAKKAAQTLERHRGIDDGRQSGFGSGNSSGDGRGRDFGIDLVGRDRSGSVVVKRAAKKAARKYPTVGRKSAPAQRSRGTFAFGEGRPIAFKPEEPKTTFGTQSFTTVNVFYATDREPESEPSKTGVLQYSNRLAEVSKLSYGVCTVTIPENHKTNQIESPSIWRFQVHEDPKKHFTLQQCSTRTPAAFFNELSRIIAKGEKKTAFVFIHGFNVAFDAAVKRTAQLNRDMKFPGAPILYSWASGAAKSLYAKDEETVALTVDRLVGFLKTLTETSGAAEIHLIAHSMGNRALINALKELQAPSSTAHKRFKQIVLTAPDVPRQDAEKFISAANANAERVTLYASNRDRALLLSRKFHNNCRLGFVYDFPYVISGLDSIDASNVETDFLGHSFFSDARTVLADLTNLVLYGEAPARRFGLKELATPSGLCWQFD